MTLRQRVIRKIARGLFNNFIYGDMPDCIAYAECILSIQKAVIL